MRRKAHSLSKLVLHLKKSGKLLFWLQSVTMEGVAETLIKFSIWTIFTVMLINMISKSVIIL